MISIRETIIVEGKYDKNKLKQIVDTQIIETSGFGVFKDAEKRELIRKISAKNGIIIFTDSDGAGFVIRNYLRGVLEKGTYKHAYIPQIEGKEKRKSERSKEGLLGVEGVSDEIIIKALRNAGATILGEDVRIEPKEKITKTDMYENGLSGGKESSVRRERLAEELSLPKTMTSNALVEAMNILITRDEFLETIKRLFG